MRCCITLAALTTRMANVIVRILWTLIWLILLLVLAIWIAMISGFVYVIVSIFTPCIPALQPLKDLCQKGLDLANTCSSNAVSGKTGI